MTSKDLRYARQIADLLGMRHWELEESLEPAESDAHATTMIQDYNTATLRFGAQYRASDLRQKQVTIIHELLHCPIYRIVDPIISMVHRAAELIPEPQRAVYRQLADEVLKQAQRQEEAEIENLARALAQLTPKMQLTGGKK